ncbi:hypothetical protein Athai_13650 [Actinocatenispora thailandica]|uniref:Carrier domain-containing protein n=1 Tax=Actinocatenispora thailandica TaxID=227318 RepID=A0A7R7HV75_9ACTN|nr:non-ribosomal peptide synthetase [Actinocatenispora thailandica]BCJ33862.1 hypothetical protein Athai_13650 [Actinocatenispora thailandica]
MDTHTGDVRAALAEQLRHGREAPAGRAGVEFVPGALSPSEQRIWFVDQSADTMGSLNTHLARRLSGSLDVAALRASIEVLCSRHEPLRSTYAEHDGEPHRVPYDRPPMFEVRDLRGRPEDAMELVSAEVQREFALASEPPLRTMLLRIADDEHILVFTVHHIAFDGTSVAVLVREIRALYTRELLHVEAQLPELKLPYAEVVAQQRERGENPADAAYWGEQLAGAPALTAFPGDRPRPAKQSYHGATRTFTIDAETAAGLSDLGRTRSATRFMVLYGSFATLLSRYGAGGDVVIGAPIANRTASGLDDLIGCFVNLLPLRLRVDMRESFEELLDRTRTMCLDAYAHQAIRFERLVRLAGLERSADRHPLFQTMLVLQPGAEARLDLPGLAETALVVPTSHSQLDVTVTVIEESASLHGFVEFSTDLFDPPAIDRLIGHWQQLLRAAVERPTVPVGELALMNGSERAELAGWQCGGDVLRAPGGLHELVAREAARRPDAVAVVAADGRLSFGELEQRAAGIAGALADNGVRRGDVVAVVLERCTDLVAALYGVLKAGAAFLPITPGEPAERSAAMLTESAAVAVVTHTRHVPAGVSPAALVLLDDQLSPPPADFVAVACRDADAAYVLYTSGSTGGPKGAVNTHGGIVNRLLWMRDTYGIGADDRVLHKTPISFDVSIWEVFLPLICGATLVMARPDGHRDPQYLLSFIAEQSITVTHFVPSMLREFVAQPGLDRCAALRQVFCSGEVLPADLSRALGAELPVRLHNLYGPTEAAIDVTAWECGPLDGATVPIGRPIAGVRALVLDERMRPTPCGVRGELYLGGVALARGYLGLSGLTAARFVPDPGGNGERLYRTGDRARWRPDGSLEFCGRLDDQLKIRGVRIEPVEVEAVIAGFDGVAACAVAGRALDGIDRLVAFVVMEGGTSVDIDALRRFIRGQLPDGMAPSVFSTVAALPLTNSGKLDRAALSTMEVAPVSASGDGREPRTATERIVAQVWREVLRAPDVGVDDSFFDLGGHSLLLTGVLAKLREHFPRVPPVRVFFEDPTVAGLALAITRMMADAASPDLIQRLLKEAAGESPRGCGVLRERPAPVVDVTDPVAALMSGADSANDNPGIITTFVMPTCDRVAAFERGLSSYIANAERHRRSVEFAVLDNSAEAVTRARYRELLSSMAARTGRTIRYAGFEEKHAWAERLARETDVPREVIVHALLGHRDGTFSNGGNVNSWLLDTVGEMVMSADDDTICDLFMPPGASADAVAVRLGVPDSNWAFGSREEMFAAIEPVDVDLLAAQEAMLGRSPAGFAAGLRDRNMPIEVQRLDPALVGGAPGVHGRVAVTVPSLVGDCGWASPSPYLRLEGDSFTRLTRDEATYRQACTSRLNLRFVDRPTFAGRVGSFMNTFYGLDNRDIAMPNLPSARGNDTVSGATATACMPGAYFGHVPLAIRHEPMERRRFWPGEVVRSASGVDFSSVLVALVQAWEADDVMLTDAGRMRALGRHLGDLARSPEPEFHAEVERVVRARAEAELAEMETRLAAGGPRFWTADLASYLRVRRESMERQEFTVPLDLLVDHGLQRARELTQEFVAQFGDLLRHWPALVDGARRLRQAGVRLSVVCDGAA